MEKPENREEYYDVGKDNYSNVKEYDMSADIELDQRRYRKYKLKGNFSINGAQVSAGTTSSGQFLSNTAVSFADTVGNRVLDISAYTVSSYESYRVNYLDRSKRWQWGAYLDSTQSYILENRFLGNFSDRGQRTFKYNELGGVLRFPFTLNARIDFMGGVTDQDRWSIFERVDNQNREFLDYAIIDYTEPFVEARFSWDSALYKQYGAQHGTLFDVGLRHDFNQYTSLDIDFRTYREITARSLFAFRLVANYSEPLEEIDPSLPASQQDGLPAPRYYFLGGNDNLRGDYYYQEFVGSRRLLAQAELRFPIVDALVFAGGIGFRDIRGALFVDVGGTWFDDDRFNFEFQESLPPELQAIVDESPLNEEEIYDLIDPSREYYNPYSPNDNYLLGAYGVQLSMNLLGFNVHWTWASRTNFEDFPKNSRMSFWIGYSF